MALACFQTVKRWRSCGLCSSAQVPAPRDLWWVNS